MCFYGCDSDGCVSMGAIVMGVSLGCDSDGCVSMGAIVMGVSLRV